MINFFRKIRKQLSNDNPTSAKASDGIKTGKYLKYAIGEIVLVMIGILLALQVNNWNENRKEKSERDYVIHELLAEYQVNLVILRRCVEKNKGYLSQMDAMLNDFKTMQY